MMPGLGGPACAIASDVPPKSSATIARLFMVLIYTSGCLRRTHPDEHENALRIIGRQASGFSAVAVACATNLGGTQNAPHSLNTHQK